MKTRQLASIAVVAGLITSARAAEAQPGHEVERSYVSVPSRMSAPRDALELTLGAGYTRGFGKAIGRAALPDIDVDQISSAGASFDLGFGYRWMPELSLTLEGGYQSYGPADGFDVSTLAHGATAVVSATYHFTPDQRFDPWLELGAGYRYLRGSGRAIDDVHLHGIEVLRLALGFDFRVSPDIAIAPTIGGDLVAFLWSGSAMIESPGVSTFVHAGMLGRFDFGGTREPQVVTSAVDSTDEHLQLQ